MAMQNVRINEAGSPVGQRKRPCVSSGAEETKESENLEEVQDNKKSQCDLCLKPVAKKCLKKHRGSLSCRRAQRRLRPSCQSEGCDNKSTYGHWDALTGEYVYTRCDDHLSEINNTKCKRRSPTRLPQKSLAYFLRFLVFCSYNHLKILSSHWYVRRKLKEEHSRFCKPEMECTICGNVFSTTCVPSILMYNRGCKCAKNIRKWSSQEKMDEYFDQCRRDKRGIICMVKDYPDVEIDEFENEKSCSNEACRNTRRSWMQRSCYDSVV